MTIDLPAGFLRAESHWLYGMPETTPEYDEWCEAQEEKKTLLQKAAELLQDLPTMEDIITFDDLDYAIGRISGALSQIIPIQEDLAELIETFPEEFNEDPDQQYDDSWVGAD